MKRCAWVHQWSHVPWSNPDAAGAALRDAGIDEVLVKTHDGPYWMSGIYSHPMVPSSVPQMLRLAQRFDAYGVRLGAWVDPRRSRTEAARHAEVGQALGFLSIDFEYQYDGFWQSGVSEWMEYRDALLSFGIPDCSVAPDPRQPGRDYPLACLEGFTSYVPQAYWTDFRRPESSVMEQAYGHYARNNRIGKFEPFVPRDGAPTDVVAALNFCLERGSPRVHLWRLPADNIGVFAARLPGELNEVPGVDDVAIPQQYLDRGWNDWNAVYINLEGIIAELLSKQRTAYEDRDKAIQDLVSCQQQQQLPLGSGVPLATLTNLVKNMSVTLAELERVLQTDGSPD